MIRNIAWLFLPVLLAVACNTSKYPGEINSIDSLVAKIDSSKSQLAKIDTTEWESSGGDFSKKFGYIEKYYTEKGDTIGPDLAYLLSDFANLKKSYSHFNPEYTAVKKELDFSRQQLVNLRHDLEYNLLDASLVTKVVKTEKEAATTAVKRTADLKTAKDSIDTKLRVYIPKIDSLAGIIQSEK